MKFKELLTESINKEYLEDILTIFSNKFNYDGSYGNCGVFAVALNKFLGGGGTYMVLVEPDEPEYYSHVALKKDGILYDFDGITTKSKMKNDYADGRGSFIETDDDDNVIKYTESKNTEEELLDGLNKSKKYLDSHNKKKE
jgi:hypothetical protein